MSTFPKSTPEPQSFHHLLESTTFTQFSDVFSLPSHTISPICQSAFEEMMKSV